MERQTSGMAKKQVAGAEHDKSEVPNPKSPGKRKSVARKTAAPRPAKPAAAKLSKEIGAVVKAALDKKAEDLVVLDLRTAGGFTDFFVICTGANARQISAIADSVREVLKKDFDERPALAEGIDRSEWVLLDYFDFVVHIFSRDCRAFYGLERLWGNAERHEFGDTPDRRA
jgi:ribosome-associated protein